MPFLIDGHNLIPHIQGLNLAQLDDEIKLLKLLDEYFKKERKKAVIFFDRAAPGQEQDITRGFVSAHFTRPPLNADKAIRNAIRKLGKAASNYTVVSSDLEVIDNARRMGARVITSAEFAQRLSFRGSSKKNNGIALEEDVDYWLRVFKRNS